MSIDIGDLITLNSTSIGVNDGNATLVVTFPDGTTATTTPGIAWANGYSATFRPSVAGRHTVQFTTANYVDQNVFDVGGTTIGFISLSDARNWLRIRTQDTGDDDKIAALIETASDLIQDVTGPVLQTVYVESFDGGQPNYTVAHTPILSVTKIDEFYGTSHLVLTEQPLGNQTNVQAFTVDYRTGEVTRRTFGGQASLFAQGTKNCIITYTAQLTPIPAALQMACRELVAHLYRQMQVPSGKPRTANMGDMEGVGPLPFAMSSFVLDLIPLKYRRPPGIA